MKNNNAVPATIYDETEVMRRFNEWHLTYKKAGGSFVDCCRELVAFYEWDAHLAEDILVEHGFNSRVLKRMLEVGRGTRMEALIWPTNRAQKELAKCDVSVQRSVLAEPIEVVNANGPSETRLIPFAELTTRQAEQVFDNGAIRSLCQQRSYLEAQAPAVQHIRIEKPYRVMRGKVEFYKPCIVPVAEMMAITQQAL